MNQQEFEITADSLAEGVRGGRHLFFIREPEDKLLNLLRTSLKRGKQPANRLQILCVEAIAESLTNRDVELRLRQKIKEHLERIRNVGTPQFLVLTKPMLLVRYQIGLSLLYEDYLVDGTCAVVVLQSIPSQNTLEALPSCVKVNTEILRKPFPEVGRAESPLIEL